MCLGQVPLNRVRGRGEKSLTWSGAGQGRWQGTGFGARRVERNSTHTRPFFFFFFFIGNKNFIDEEKSSVHEEYTRINRPNYMQPSIKAKIEGNEWLVTATLHSMRVRMSINVNSTKRCFESSKALWFLSRQMSHIKHGGITFQILF